MKYMERYFVAQLSPTDIWRSFPWGHALSLFLACSITRTITLAWCVFWDFDIMKIDTLIGHLPIHQTVYLTCWKQTEMAKPILWNEKSRPMCTHSVVWQYAYHKRYQGRRRLLKSGPAMKHPRRITSAEVGLVGSPPRKFYISERP